MKIVLEKIKHFRELIKILENTEGKNLHVTKEDADTISKIAISISAKVKNIFSEANSHNQTKALKEAEKDLDINIPILEKIMGKYGIAPDEHE